MTSVLSTGTPPLGDRDAVATQLAQRLTGFASAHPVVVAVAPEGVAIAAEVAHTLGAPLDVIGVQPLTLGGAEQGHFGTAAEGGITLFDPARRDAIESAPEAVDAVLLDAEARLQRRAASWRRHHRRQSLRGRLVLLVAEPLTDGQAAAAAACAARDRGAAEVVYVTPQAELEAALVAVEWMDEIVCLQLREHERGQR